jgi:hypothetical protein
MLEEGKSGASHYLSDFDFLPLLHNICGGEGWGEEVSLFHAPLPVPLPALRGEGR